MNPRLVVVTGVAGAGKTTFMSECENSSYRAVDALPLPLLASLLNLMEVDPNSYRRVAIFFSPSSLEEALPLISTVRERIPTLLVGLDCNLEALLSRFRLTRHLHPLEAQGLSLEEAIKKEKETLKLLRPSLDFVLDTSSFLERDLRLEARRLLGFSSDKLSLIFRSFGYKFGVPGDAETIIDCRSLANPHWVKELREKDGRTPESRSYILNDPLTAPFLSSLFAFLDDFFLTAEKAKRGRVHVDFACTGGFHRSVFVSEECYKHYCGRYQVALEHRDIPSEGTR